MEIWKQRDPIFTLEARLASLNIMSAEDAAEEWATQRADIADAIEFAEASPLPNRDQLLEDVYTKMSAA